MAAPEPEELQQEWTRWLVERNRRGARVVLWLNVFLYPAFGLLDYLMAPARWLPVLWGLRAVVTIYTLVMFALLNTRVFERHTTPLTAIYIAVVGAGISFMASALGGLASPYYAGLHLVMVGAALLFVWPRSAVLATNAAIVLSFVLPNVWNVAPHEVTPAVSNLAVLVSMALIVASGQVLTYRSQHMQLVTRLTLERTKSDLETAHEQLKELDRYRTRFFANITHELRTPLTLILSPVDAILQSQVGDFSPAQAEYLHGIRRNGLRLLKLINDLLDLVKLEESRLTLQVTETDLRRLLARIADVVRPLAERKGIHVTLEEFPTPSNLWLDRDQFERVVVNLLSNAIKFTKEGGHVTVRAEETGASAIVEVRDDGIGIPHDQLGRIFDRFTQVDDSVTRRHGGTGIGLAVAKEIVELHGGTIHAESAPGEGTRMIIELPSGRAHFPDDAVHRSSEVGPDGTVEEATRGEEGLHEWMTQILGSESYRFLAIEQHTERRAVRRDPAEQLRTHKVIVVDDSVDMLEFLQFQLHDRFRVYAAQNGEMAWELIRRENPDVVVSDYMMPGMDGMQLCARVKKNPDTRHIPFVLLSAKAEVADRVAGHEAGADAYLAKPFRPQELFAVLERQIAAREAMADELLEKRMRSLDVLSAGLAHEIRNPLSYLQNGLFVLQRSLGRWEELEPDDEEGRAKLRAIMKDVFEAAQKGVQRIQAVVDRLKEYSRQGYARVEREFPADDAVRSVLPLLSTYQPKAVSVHSELAANVHILGAPEEFNQVITNLVQNALDAVSDGGNVWVSTALRNGQFELRVRDDGSGIAPDDQRHIFSPFFSSKPPGEGMGLGLTIVHRLVQRAGGEISLSSEPGVGTEFTVTLPVADRAALPATIE